ncbi:Lrp/AsnC family transcriptional regulator [Neomicrococcus aestuarii]|uniref:Lrp/AsnC family transcriptional regulator n=1 Tax=Neomicrococcus aestuarii TaxID=556325 RepID=UPI000A032D01
MATEAGDRTGSGSRAEHGDPSAPERFPLDEISKNIIGHLQEDGRRSYASIGKAVGLSEAAVRQRVQKLLDSKVIQIVAVTDPLQLGFPRNAMIGVRCTGDMIKTADEIAKLAAVDYCVVTAGKFDVLAEVVCENDEDLLDIIHTIRAIKSVRETETFMYLSLRKQIYNWGTP